MARALLQIYRQAAFDHSIASESGDYRAGNRAYDRIASVFKEMVEAQCDHELFSLYEDPETGVQTWAAVHTLELDPTRAEKKLAELSALPSMIGFDAEMSLQEWKAGNLRFREPKH